MTNIRIYSRQLVRVTYRLTADSSDLLRCDHKTSGDVLWCLAPGFSYWILGPECWRVRPP